MDGSPHISWEDGNREITSLLLRHMALRVAGEDTQDYRFDRQIEVVSNRMDSPPAIARIAARFGLDALDQQVLALVALADQPAVLSAALQAHDLSVAGRATPALVLDVLGETAEVALAPGGPLRAGGLIAIAEEGRAFDRPLTLCVTALELLQGRVALDPIWYDLSSTLHRAPDGSLDRAFVERLGASLQAALAQDTAPMFWAGGSACGASEAAMAMVAAALGLPVVRLSETMLPLDPRDRADALRALCRDVALTGTIIILQGKTADIWDVARGLPGPSLTLTDQAPDRLPQDALRLDPPVDTRNAATIWSEALDPQDAHSLQTDQVAQHFRLSPAQARRALSAVQIGVSSDLWHAARAEARDDFGGLAQRIDHPSAWDDLVLPAAQEAALEQMTGFLRNRALVNDTWGFAGKTPRGLGMAALFYGDSGTGKTTAAEALVSRVQSETAGQTGLYRVNVAALVSKYIGETSKNFLRVFEAGAASGAALLFDEAEGLFGRRSTQNRESLDKHSNAELGFLLQCLDSYPGIAILTTNLRQAIDDAFFRRFRFAIEFPFPDRAQRALIWQRVLPAELPTGTLDFDALAGLSLSGGNIRSVAVNGAYMAASDEGILEMRHLAQATRLEFAKLEKPVPERDLKRWLT